MPRPLRALLASLACSALLLMPRPGLSEALMVTKGSAGASLDFRIIIPPVMRVLENSHPAQLGAASNGEWVAQQRLVVLSNMKRGFCVNLRMSSNDIDNWRLQTEQLGGITLNPTSEGYRLCTPRSGRYTLLLEHEFETRGDRALQSHSWPVQTDITAL